MDTFVRVILIALPFALLTGFALIVQPRLRRLRQRDKLDPPSPETMAKRLIALAAAGIILAIGFLVSGQWMGAAACLATVPLFALAHRSYAKDWRKTHRGDRS